MTTEAKIPQTAANNFGCRLRDEIWERISKTFKGEMIDLKRVKSAISKLEIPEQYWNDVYRMWNSKQQLDVVEMYLFERVAELALIKVLNE